jgi:ParB family transcriptional regulator, chromosome partitioning protein
MPKQRIGLGRGLNALIPGASSVPDATTLADELPMDTNLSPSALYEVPVTAISPNPLQPRMPISDDDEQLLELAASIQEYGLLQPLLVKLVEADDESVRFQLIAGERRWRAAQLAGLERVPVIVHDATPQLMLEMALVENLQRTDLNPLEAAQGYVTLIEEYGLTQEQVAERVGLKRPTIANTIRLLQLPQQVREALITMPKVFTEGHARAVLQIAGEVERINFKNLIISKGMSVREAEDLAKRYTDAALRLTPDRRGARVAQQSYETLQLQEEFTRAVEMKVRLQRSVKGKGSLTLFFSTDDQLQRLYEWLVQSERTGRPHDGGNRNGGLGYARENSDSLDGLLDDAFDITFDSGGETGGEN